MTDKKIETMTLYDFSAKNILGDDAIDFNQFRNKVVIVVNAASYCGFTKTNYTGFSTLLDRFYDKGLRVLVFPCNQFMGQERDAPSAIKAFAEQYDKRFVLAEKIDVNGSEAHPLFMWLKERCPGFLVDAIKWNFTKVCCLYLSSLTHHHRAIASFSSTATECPWRDLPPMTTPPSWFPRLRSSLSKNSQKSSTLSLWQIMA